MSDDTHARDGETTDLAFRDDLTGLANRRLLTGLLADGWGNLVREHGRVSLLMIDLDRFKEVNDTHGHRRGDDVLRATADILRRHFRAADVIVRYGGDEFVVVLPGVGRDDAGHLGERARAAMSELAEAAGDGQGLGVSVSFSIGVASFPDDGTGGDEVLEVADRRLFEDKRHRHGGHLRSATSRRRALIAASVISVGLIAGLAVVLSSSRDERPAGARAAVPGADGAAAGREAQLLTEIAELRRQLDALRGGVTRAPAGPAPETRRSIDTLEARIRELEGELDRRPGATTPAPTVRPVPFGDGRPAATLEAQVAPALPPEAVPVEPTPQAIPPEPVVVAPVLRGYDEPVYPATARQLGREAAVELRVMVDEAGTVVRVEPAGPRAGLGFDEAARRAALSARYRPGTRDGVPVPQEVALTIAFRLSRP
ncbi:MAG: TonB family protein [Acidobacteria bacterium]|nr:TonB family protein [Acidobacteriota bacterium]